MESPNGSAKTASRIARLKHQLADFKSKKASALKAGNKELADSYNTGIANWTKELGKLTPKVSKPKAPDKDTKTLSKEVLKLKGTSPAVKKTAKKMLNYKKTLM